MMREKTVIGIIGFSDGDPEVHEQLKDIVQEQVTKITKALRDCGEVEVIEAKTLVHSARSAKEQAEYLKNQGVDGTIFAYGVFAFPNFSAIAAQNGKGPVFIGGKFEPGLAGDGSYASGGRGAAPSWN